MLLFGALHTTLSVVFFPPRGWWDLSIAIGTLPVLLSLVFKDRRTHTHTHTHHRPLAPLPPCPLPPPTHLLAPVWPPYRYGYGYPRAQVPSVLQPMVLSLSLELLVDRRTVQEVCQQAQLHKLGQSVQVRSRRERQRERATPPTPPSAPRCTPPCPSGPRIPPLVRIPAVQAQARLRDAKRAAGLDERNVQARPSPPILED